MKIAYNYSVQAQWCKGRCKGVGVGEKSPKSLKGSFESMVVLCACARGVSGLNLGNSPSQDIRVSVSAEQR